MLQDQELGAAVSVPGFGKAATRGVYQLGQPEATEGVHGAAEADPKWLDQTHWLGAPGCLPVPSTAGHEWMLLVDGHRTAPVLLPSVKTASRSFQLLHLAAPCCFSHLKNLPDALWDGVWTVVAEIQRGGVVCCC